MCFVLICLFFWMMILLLWFVMLKCVILLCRCLGMNLSCVFLFISVKLLNMKKFVRICFGVRLMVFSRIVIGILWWWLMWKYRMFFGLNLKLSYELWYGMICVENSSLFELCVLFLLCLKNMLGEWCSCEMMICLVLLMMNEFVGVMSGILFMYIFCFFIFLMIGLFGDFLLRMMRWIFVCSVE